LTYSLDVNKNTSKRMSSIIPNKTRPESIIKNLIKKLGFYYTNNVTTLPGRPDIVFHDKKKIIFVHGCFWHRHFGCKKTTLPKTNKKYWIEKFDKTCKRDKKNLKELIDLGWKYKIIWECQISDLNLLENEIKSFLED
jgi:DNA mismatch endonuclease, patch repair protein